MSNQPLTIGRPHLTAEELADRLNCVAKTVRRNYPRWGLRPITITGQLLFPLQQVEELERRAVSGELRKPRSSRAPPARIGAERQPIK
jgi:hypothetical protein